MYIAGELQEICNAWDLLLKYFKEFLSMVVFSSDTLFNPNFHKSQQYSNFRTRKY